MQRSQLYSHTARCLPWPLTNHWLIPLIQVLHPSYYSSSPPWWLTSQPAVYPSSWGSRMLFASCIQSYTYSSCSFPLPKYFEIALHADQGWIFKNVSLVSSSSGSFPPRSPSDFSIWFLNRGGYPIPWICPVHTAQDTVSHPHCHTHAWFICSPPRCSLCRPAPCLGCSLGFISPQAQNLLGLSEWEPCPCAIYWLGPLVSFGKCYLQESFCQIPLLFSPTQSCWKLHLITVSCTVWPYRRSHSLLKYYVSLTSSRIMSEINYKIH